jgi:hypothetical protein
MHFCRTKEEQAVRWRAAGIPDGYRVSRLLYNAAAAVIVAELRGMNDGYLADRLVMRHASTDTYQPIGTPGPHVSFESSATCEKKPIVVFNSMTWQRDPEGRRSGANWDGLYVFNLETNELTLSVAGNSLVVPAPYDERGWVSDVLDLSDDAGHAYVRVGLGKRQDEGESKNIYYDYHIARLKLRSRELEVISKLENVWF